MSKIEVGQKVSFDKILRRRTVYGDFGYNARRKEWSDVESKEKVGFVVGIRTLQNGLSTYENEVGWEFFADERFKAYLVVTSLGRKPFFVREVTVQSSPPQ